MDGEVMIVDEHTGRILAGRRYNEGMHQAIEAKEGVEIKSENQTLATITLQNYFRLYDKLAGMTGTAQTEAAEFHQIYKLGVVPIPTNKPMHPHRQARPRLPHRGGEVRRGRRRHRGAARDGSAGPGRHDVSVAKSEYLSEQLRRSAASRTRCSTPSTTSGRPRSSPRRAARAPVTVADQHGRPRAPTSCSAATRSSGRSPRCGPAGSTRHETPEEYEAAWDEALAAGRGVGGRRARRGRRRWAGCTSWAPSGTSRGASTTSSAGGPAGRATRASPGSTCRCRTTSCGCSTPRWSTGSCRRSAMPDDVPIESKMVTRAIASAQSRSRRSNFETRKNVLKYDDVLNRQREVIYAERRRVLEGEDLHEQVRHFINDVVGDYVTGAGGAGLADGMGPRAALARAASRSTRSGSRRAGRRGGREPRRRHHGPARRGADQRRPARLRRRGRPSSARRSCVTWSGGSCCRSWTASGASTSTRWTTSRRASACARWRSASRSSSTSARATSCSRP